MKKSNLLLIMGAAVLAGVLNSGCSLNQDPYAEKSEEIRNGVPPELDREPAAPKPLASDALRIDSLDFYSFREQVESEIVLSGRVLQPNPSFELSIDNISEFPGAKFDAKTGSFKWLPPKETTGGEYGVAKRLIARLTAPSATGGPLLGTTKAILVYVTRAEVDPEILSVDDLVRPNPTREGEIRRFTVVVRDPDSVDVDGARPVLNAVPSQRGPSDISGLVYMQETSFSEKNPVQDPNDKRRWIFKMVMDLRVPANQRGRDFTANQANFRFGLQAVSRFGRVAMKNVDASVITDVLKPDASWFDAIEAVAGQENIIQFTAFDPYSEGKISVNFVTRVDQLPGSAVSFCKAASRDGNMLCRISWKPLPTTKGDFPIEFTVTNESRVVGDRKVVSETFRRVIKVVPGATVSPPTPGPGPAPGPAPTPTPAPGPITLPGPSVTPAQ